MSASTRRNSNRVVQALVRVEGLVRGGAAGLDGFLDMLKPLRQPLTVQVNDRSDKIIVGIWAGRRGLRDGKCCMKRRSEVAGQSNRATAGGDKGERGIS